MARGRKTSLTIRLTPAERQTLLAWQRATTSRAGLVRRTRIILLLAEGVTITTIAATVGLSRTIPTSGYSGLCRKGWRGWKINQDGGAAVGASRHKHSAIWMWDNDTRVYAAGVLPRL